MAFLRRAAPHQNVPRQHLILVDLNLPIMDGREALARIKKDDCLRASRASFSPWFRGRLRLSAGYRQDCLRLENIHCYAPSVFGNLARLSQTSLTCFTMVSKASHFAGFMK